MATGTQQFLTGKPQFAFQKAAQAGAASAAGNSALSDAFNTFAKGNGDPVDLSQRVQGAVQGMKSDALNAWKQSKGNLINSTTAPVDLSPVWQSIQDARSNLSPMNVAGPPAQAAHKALSDAESMVWDRALSNDPADRSLEGMDQLKQELREMYAGQGKGQLAENALKSVHAGVRQAIGNASPEYNGLMGGYQRILDDLQDVTKSAGASDKTAATTQLQRLVRAQKTPEGQTLISRLGERDPTIPYMLAGSALHDTLAGGVSGAAEKFSAPFHMLNIGRAMMSGDPADIGEALALPVLQGTVQSPRVMGGLNYGAGYAAGKVGQSAPARAAGVVTAAHGSAAYHQPVPHRARYASHRASLARASGGSVKKPTHEQLLARLMNMVETSQEGREKPHEADAQRSG